ncbi:MAG: RadC family protein [Acutalibacteraceae bacterium]
MSDKNDNMHKGHRQKVKERYYASGMDSMPDHNILEMLLFFAIPLKDTNETAHLLMEKFGSFSGVLKADIADLKSVKGMTENAACLISMLLPIYKRYNEDLVSKKPELKSAEEIVSFIRPKFVDSSNERVYALCFDNCHKLICAKMLNEGDISSAYFDLRQLASTVLETKTKNVVIVHNHPTNIALPSTDDVKATQHVYDFLKYMKVNLNDHIIVTEKSFCSMANTPRYAYIFYGLKAEDFDKDNK